MKTQNKKIFNLTLIYFAIKEAFKKMNPRIQYRNPVIFITYIGSILTTLFLLDMFINKFTDRLEFTGIISFWLWFTVLFSNFSEALAEGHSKAQTNALKKIKEKIFAKKLKAPYYGAEWKQITAEKLNQGNNILVENGDLIPCDGKIISGKASIDENTITGESAPIIKESGGNLNSVIGGTRIISDWLIIQCNVNIEESFIEQMIKMVEKTKRRKTPTEISLTILLVSLSILFLVSTFTLWPFSTWENHKAINLTTLIALLVCLIPTTIGGLLSAIGIAGINRVLEANIIATSGRAVETAGDIDILLLDKTGTITLGNRKATHFFPSPGYNETKLANAAYLASLSDNTPEGRSIVLLAKKKILLHKNMLNKTNTNFVPFSAQTRISGINIKGHLIRKDAIDAIRYHIENNSGFFPNDIYIKAKTISYTGSTPLLVSEDNKILGIIKLKDIVKIGIKERFEKLRKMGIKIIMITGDNSFTATTIAKEVGIDDFISEATPETKLKLIRKYQEKGYLVAMTGDGTNDAPALAQADIGMAMNSGTQAAKEAGNMLDLESNPTKLLEVIHIGKQMLITRGSLTTFSIANDLAKYFAIIPTAFTNTHPELSKLNIMKLHSPSSAIISAVIFNALIIVCLIPVALKGVKYYPTNVANLLRRNLIIYGLGGLLVPFIGIKIIDLFLTVLTNVR